MPGPVDTSPPAPRRAPVHSNGRVDPSQAGARWWMYRRPPVTTPAPPSAPSPGEQSPVERSEPEASADATKDRAHLPSGRAGGIVAVGLLVVVIIGTRGFGQDTLGVVLIPMAGIVGVVAFGRRCARVHPDEPWLPRLLLLGTLAKLTASYLRFLTLTDAYGGVGDATEYDIQGRRFVAAWVGERASAPVQTDLRQSNFVRWFTGVVYYLFGQSLVGAFLLFGLFAIIGSYFWYRALVDSVPYANKRLFLIFMMFAPSIVFWPSSLGKEALMQLGLGAMAWATGLLLTGHFNRALPLMAGGGWLLWVIRPHLLALVAVAGAVPYFVGRIRRGGKSSFLGRPMGMAIVGLLVVFTLTTGAKYMGIDELSVDAVEAQLDETTARTSQGGSSFSHGSNSLNPVNLPWGLVTVLFRPFPWETSSGFQVLAALESMVVLGLILHRFDSLRLAFKRWRKDPFLLYCIVLLILYAMIYSAFANFGLLTRQRSLVLPALYVLIAVEPALLRKDDRGDDVPEPVRSGR